MGIDLQNLISKQIWVGFFYQFKLDHDGASLAYELLG